MEMRDVIHGSIQVNTGEVSVIDTRYFQRLRQIKQLGFAETAFPSATHNRYIHSLGALETATQMFDALFGGPTADPKEPALPHSAWARFRRVVRLAALLHDVGHGPLSHTTEFAMPPVKELKLPISFETDSPTRKATHEDYTLKILLDSELTPVLNKIGKPHGFSALHVAALVEPKIKLTDSFFDESITLPDDSTQTSIHYRPLLQQLISSELDADRMDYLRRDSLQAGVSYGHFDFNWLLHNLIPHYEERNAFLAIQHRALYTFEDFLISRFHMFLMVYFHHKSVIYDEMLAQYLSHPECEYVLPADIEEYCKTNDGHLYAHLTESSNDWAKRIIQKRPYLMFVELHSGIPATQIAKVEQEKLLREIQADFTKKKVHYLLCTSTSELSKYFRRPGVPLFVRYDNHFNTPSFIPLEQCTDLFEKYGEKRTVTRLYVSPEDYSKCRPGKGTQKPLRYD